jgi:RNA polymerase sigma factor FliA
MTGLLTRAEAAPVMTVRHKAMLLQSINPDDLIKNNLPLVRKIAWHVHGRISRGVEIDDLVQSGMIALVESARTYQDYGEASFQTYASIRIRGAMMDQLRRQATMTRGALKRRRDLLNLTRDLSVELKRPPTPDEIRQRLGLSHTDYQSLQQEIQGLQYESLDDAYSDHSPWFADDSDSPLQQLEGEELKAQLADAIRQLPEREALTLQLYFSEEMNLEEIGAVLGVGAARVCQIKASALAKVRNILSPGDDS